MAPTPAERDRRSQRYISGLAPAPVCPCCGHVPSVHPLSEVAPRPWGNPYGRAFYVFRPDLDPNRPLGHPLVTNGLRELGYAAPSAPLTVAHLRDLRPPEPPLSRWHALDRRLTLVVDLAFAGVALAVLGWATRSAFEGVALAFGLVATLVAAWLLVALATGRFARANAVEQATYERAMRRWQALFYCEDCGSVFRRDRQGYLRADKVPGYLRRDSDDDTIAANTPT